MKNEQTKHFRSIKYDRNTKVGVLYDQFTIYFSSKSMEEKFQTEEYILKIIAQLKTDFAADPVRYQLLEDLVYEVRFNSGNRKGILAILQKL